MALLDLPLPPERALLKEVSSRFAQRKSPVEELRAADGLPDHPQSSITREAGELGWFAMLVPPELGGGSVSGSGLADAAVIATERGASLQPGPFTAMNVVAETLARAGTEEHRKEVVPSLVSGEHTASWAVADRRGGWEPGCAVRYDVDGGTFVLNGSSILVEGATAAQWLLVTAGSVRGTSAFLVPTREAGITIESWESLDITRRFAAVEFQDVRVRDVDLVGALDGAAGLAERQLQVAAILTAADAIGAMGRDFDMVVDHATKRIAFGRPIGSFQAIKHLLADTSLLLEASKAIVQAAVDADGSADFARFASVAKAFVSESAIELGQNCLQVLGGVGFTWEHEHHLYMRRMTTDALLYGDPAVHRELLCASYGLREVARS